MAFYKIVANNTVWGESQSGVKSNETNDTLIGHINSEQIGNKYVYVIHFDNNIDSNQELTDCSLLSSNETSLIETKNANEINFDLKTIEEFAHILNNNNINKTNEQLNESNDKFENFNPNFEPKQECEEKDHNMNGINNSTLYKKSADKAKHSEMRPFVCQWPHCHKRFNRKGILITHMRTHTGERPFRCDWTDCGKSFNQICVLKNHKRTHTGERPYVCDWTDCGHSFKTSGSLHHHRMNHEGKQQTIKKYKRITAKFVANNKVYKNKTNKTLETTKNSSVVKINNNDCNDRNDNHYLSDSEKFALNSKISENEGKNSYECTFENCHQKFARKCALINHFNYRHQSDCY